MIKINIQLNGGEFTHNPLDGYDFELKDED